MNQRLRAGFPPRELKPGVDPNLPVQLVNGERVQVDVVNVQQKPTPGASAVAVQNRAAHVPPKELKPGPDCNLPVQLANRGRVQVDVVNNQPKQTPGASAAAVQSDAEKGILVRNKQSLKMFFW